MGYLIEMYKVIRGLDEIESTKSPLLRTDIELTGPAQVVRGDRLRLLRGAFKTRIIHSFALSVTQRHNFMAKRGSLAGINYLKQFVRPRL